MGKYPYSDISDVGIVSYGLFGDIIMALAQYGGGILDMRGSIGGQVHSRNRFGNYIRARTTPVNPQSSRQNVIRASVASLAQDWSNTLTQTQRDQWEVYADAIVRTNALGAQIKLTGFNHFIRSNSIRLQSAKTVIVSGPSILTLPPMDPAMIAAVDETNQEISVAFNDTFDWLDLDDAHMFVFMSSPKAAGTNFIGGPFRLAGVIDGDSITPPTTPTILDVPFPVAVDQEVVVRARISEDDGRLSDLFRSQSTVLT